jgi:CheY-like chemotaxis protein
MNCKQLKKETAMKVLIVDDIPVNRKLLRAILQEGGHSAIEAADGVEALALLEKTGADAVISDILMPHMDGYLLCCEIRNDKRFRDVPFIIYTATFTSPANAALGWEVGADLFLIKPLPGQEILDALKPFAGCKAQERAAVVIPDNHRVPGEYSQSLVDKLEKKCMELEKSRSDLSARNKELEVGLRRAAA